MKKYLMIGAATLLMAAPSFAQDDVKMYKPGDAVSAEELAKDLFPPPKSRQLVVGGAAVAEQQADTTSEAIAFPIHFAYNSYDIPQDSMSFLEAVAGLMKMEGYHHIRLIVEGHTDASGSAAYNQTLSEKRAAAVKDHLISHFAIDPSRLDVIGKGESDLFDRVSPKSAENRRVQFRKAMISDEDLFEDLLRQ